MATEIVNYTKAELLVNIIKNPSDLSVLEIEHIARRKISFVVPKYNLTFSDYDKVYKYESKCACAFEHEYFTYLPSGTSVEFDKSVFAKILAVVEKGRCEHVADTDESVETFVTPLHVFGAMGVGRYFHILSNCFSLSPLHVIVIRKQYDALKSLQYFEDGFPAKFVTRVYKDKDTASIKVDIVKLNNYQLCIYLNDLVMLKNMPVRYVRDQTKITDALHYAIVARNVEAFEILQTNMKNEKFSDIFGSSLKVDLNCARLSVLCNVPEIMSVIVKYKPKSKEVLVHESFILMALAKPLGYTKCCQQLDALKTTDEGSDPGKKRSITPSLFSSLSVMISFLQKYKFCEILPSKRVCLMFKELATNGFDINQKDSDGNTPLHLLSSSGLYQYDDHLCKTLLDMGADINATDKNGEIPLYYAVFKNKNHRYENDNKIWFIRTMLYYNPSRKHIRHWECFKNFTNFIKLGSDIRIKDRLQPVDIFQDFVDCGFLPVDYPDVRRLKDLSRDTIRNSFPGKALHSFVETTLLPHSIKDFILIKRLCRL